MPSNLGRDLTNEADAFGMGATRPHNPAARGEPLGATAPWQNRSQPKKNKPTLNTKLRILPKKILKPKAGSIDPRRGHALRPRQEAPRRHRVGSIEVTTEMNPQAMRGASIERRIGPRTGDSSLHHASTASPKRPSRWSSARLRLARTSFRYATDSGW